MRENKKTEREIKDLVRLAKKGYRGAMEELVRLSEDLVYYNCLRMLKNQEDARDMTQEVYLTVYEKLSTLKKEEAFFKWIKVITINKCKNQLQKANPYFLLEDLTQMDKPVDAMELVEDKSDQSSPEKVLDTKETEQTLLKLINSLPDAQRMCIVMFYYDDMSINDIATIMGVSPNTVKSRLTYAKLKLREGIQREAREGFNLHGYQPAAFTAFVAYYLKKTAKPDDGRVGTLLKVLRDFAASGLTGLDQALTVSAADAAIAEEAAVFCAGASSAAATGGLSAFFGAAFWTSLGGKVLLASSAALLVAGGIFGTWKFVGKGLEGNPSSGIVEMTESTQIQVADIEISSDKTPENSLESSRALQATSSTSSSEASDISGSDESQESVVEPTSSEESSEVVTQTSQESSEESSSQQSSESSEQSSEESSEESSGESSDSSEESSGESSGESSEESSGENSEESSEENSEESSEGNSEESSDESSEENSEDSSGDSSEENSEDSEIIPICPTGDVDPPPPGEYLYKHQKWDEFMAAFNTFTEAKEEAAALNEEMAEIESLLSEEGDEFTYQGTTMTRNELQSLYESKEEKSNEIPLQAYCENAKSAYNEWAVLWQMINIYLEEPGDQELSATYAPTNTNELYYY